MNSFLCEYELGKAAEVLIQVLFELKKDETIIITADTLSDKRVVDATARAAYAVGAKPMVIWTCTPPGPGRQVDSFGPTAAILAATKEADAWVEFNVMYYLYSNTHEETMRCNPKMRFVGLPAMETEVFVRLFNNTNYGALSQFLRCVTDKTQSAQIIRITTPAGQDVSFRNEPSYPFMCEDGFANYPGTHMLAGQISWSPDFDSINGTIVFDGSIVPQFGLLNEPVALEVQNGVIQKISGGRQAKQLESFLNGFEHPQMLRPAHVSYGFHPAAKLTGQLGEDERIWGGTQWGLGAVGSFLAPPHGIDGPSHIDGICLNSTVYLDGVKITDCGHLVDTELIELAKPLGMK